MLLEVVAIIAVAYFTYRLLRSNELSKIPGPSGLPLVGSMFQVDAKNPHHTFTAWAKKYGPVYRAKLGRSEIVFITGSQELNDVLIKKGQNFADRRKTYRLKLSSLNYSGLIMHGYDEEFKWMKKLMFKGLKQHNLKHIEDITLDVVSDLIDDIKELKGEVFDPSTLVFTSLFKILYVMVFSHKVDSTNKEFKELRGLDERILKNTGLGGNFLDMFPWLRFFGNKKYKQTMEILDLQNRLYNTFKEHVKTGVMDGGWFKDLVETHEKDPQRLTDDNVNMLMTEFFIAGSVTTSASIMSFLNLMVHYPEVQKKIQQEVDEKVDDSGHVTFKNRDEMPYVLACILELQRYSSIVTIGVPHKAMVDTTIGAYTIPKGTDVYINLWAHHHNPDVFPEPMTFLPERFLTSDGKLVDAGEYPRKDIFPFGAGVRVCAGETLAMSRLFIIFSRLIQNFQILPATTLQEQPSIHPMDYKFGSILSTQPYKLRMVPRQ